MRFVNKSQSGFTLVEVIIALLVASLSLVSLFMVYHIGTANSASLVEAQRADMLATSYTEDILYAARQPSASEHDGLEETADKSYFIEQNCELDSATKNNRNDQPPRLFGKVYTGVSDIYAQYTVDLDVACIDSFNASRQASDFMPSLQQLLLRITAPSGKTYEYEMVRGTSCC